MQKSKQKDHAKSQLKKRQETQRLHDELIGAKDLHVAIHQFHANLAEVGLGWFWGRDAKTKRGEGARRLGSKNGVKKLKQHCILGCE